METPRLSHSILGDNQILKLRKPSQTMTQADQTHTSAGSQTLHGWASIALEGAGKIVKEFEDKTGHTVNLEFLPSADITVNLSKGLTTDFVFYPTKPITKFTSEGVLIADGFTPVVQSGIGIAVPKTSAIKAPQNAEQLKEILLSVSSIIYATGPSGDHIETIIDQLGIRSSIQHKIKIISGLVAKGIESAQGEIGFQQIPEILLVPGAKLLSPLPADIQLLTPFSLSVHASSKKVQLCKELFHYLSHNRYKSLYADYGLEMITP